MNKAAPCVVVVMLLLTAATWILFDLAIGNMPQPVAVARVNLSCPEPYCAASVCIQDCPSCPSVPLFVAEAASVAGAHDWVEMEYMCGDFSVEVFDRLESDGYDDVRFCEGSLAGQAHYWVKIGDDIVIECTTGEVIAPVDYARDYEEYRCWDSIPSHVKRWISSYPGGGVK